MIDISEAVPEEEIRTRLDEMDVFQPDDWTDGTEFTSMVTFTESLAAVRIL